MAKENLSSPKGGAVAVQGQAIAPFSERAKSLHNSWENGG